MSFRANNKHDIGLLCSVSVLLDDWLSHSRYHLYEAHDDFRESFIKASITSEVSTDNVVCVIKQRLSSSFTLVSIHHLAIQPNTFPLLVIVLPHRPSTSGCPAWPIKMASLPLRLALATSYVLWSLKGQVAASKASLNYERASWRIA